MEAATLAIDTPAEALAQAPGWVPVRSRPRPLSRPPGRPTLYSREIADRIAGAIAEGASVRKVCAQPWAPVRQTFYHWLALYPEFSSLYDLATEARIHTLMDEMIEIADNRAIHVERARLMINVRKWEIERMRPRKYGRQARNPVPFQVTVSLRGRIEEARQRVQALRGEPRP